MSEQLLRAKAAAPADLAEQLEVHLKAFDQIENWVHARRGWPPRDRKWHSDDSYQGDLPDRELGRARLFS